MRLKVNESPSPTENEYLSIWVTLSLTEQPEKDNELEKNARENGGACVRHVSCNNVNHDDENDD